MESTVFTNLRGSEGALTFNFFCESLITSLHTLTHVMEDAGIAVPDNVGDVADAWEKWQPPHGRLPARRARPGPFQR